MRNKMSVETIESAVEPDTAIVCMIDNARVHSVQQYIKEKYEKRDFVFF